MLRELIFAQPPAPSSARRLHAGTDENIDDSIREVRQLGDISEGLLDAQLREYERPETFSRADGQRLGFAREAPTNERAAGRGLAAERRSGAPLSSTAGAGAAASDAGELSVRH